MKSHLEVVVAMSVHIGVSHFLPSSLDVVIHFRRGWQLTFSCNQSTLINCHVTHATVYYILKGLVGGVFQFILICQSLNIATKT